MKNRLYIFKTWEGRDRFASKVMFIDGVQDPIGVSAEECTCRVVYEYLKATTRAVWKLAQECGVIDFEELVVA